MMNHALFSYGVSSASKTNTWLVSIDGNLLRFINVPGGG